MSIGTVDISDDELYQVYTLSDCELLVLAIPPGVTIQSDTPLHPQILTKQGVLIIRAVTHDHHKIVKIATRLSNVSAWRWIGDCIESDKYIPWVSDDIRQKAQSCQFDFRKCESRIIGVTAPKTALVNVANEDNTTHTIFNVVVDYQATAACSKYASDIVHNVLMPVICQSLMKVSEDDQKS